MKNKELIRNITIGAVDGITIPFALVAGLTNVASQPWHIAVAGISLAAAGACTMGIGAYLEERKNATTGGQIAAPFTISLSYFLGGLIATLPFLLASTPRQALLYASFGCISTLFIAGYFESKVNDANALAGAVRVACTGAIAALAAFYVAKLFI